MTDAPQSPWDQLPGEPPEAYARFLIYRNLGPARSLDAAYKIANVGKRRKSSERSGTWQENATAHRWRERAARWDVAQLSVVVPEATGLIFQSIAEYAKIILEALQERKHTPRTWAELKDGLVVLSTLVSPDVIAAATDHAQPAGPGAGDESDGTESAAAA